QGFNQCPIRSRQGLQVILVLRQAPILTFGQKSPRTQGTQIGVGLPRKAAEMVRHEVIGGFWLSPRQEEQDLLEIGAVLPASQCLQEAQQQFLAVEHGGKCREKRMFLQRNNKISSAALKIALISTLRIIFYYRRNAPRATSSQRDSLSHASSI